ncbi:MAG: alpha/beta fold hydrolase [Atopobiaceae bacterium]
MATTPAQPHFPSAYHRPSMAPTQALRVTTPDGASLACFAYGPLTAPGGPSDLRCSKGACVLDSSAGLASGTSASPTPVLFLHGNGEEHGIFGPQIDAVLQAGSVAVTLDCRAQGLSTRGTAPLTYELMTDDALLACDALGVRRAHVVGFSDGAIEALLLARDHPERVASVVAIGTNLTPEGVDDAGFPMQQIAQANDEWADWVQDPSAHPGVDASLLVPGATECRHTADLMRLMLEHPHIDAASLARIHCPVTVMAGEFDVIFPHETAAIARAVPNARLVIAPDCGHSLPKQAPGLVSREVLRQLHAA